MIKKITLLVVLGSQFSAVQAHDFTAPSGDIVVASYDVSGSEIWNGYFASPLRLLAQPVTRIQQDIEQEFVFINRPRYIKTQMPEHRMVCQLKEAGGQGGNPDSRCRDEFPHVHVDDFKMALDFGNSKCQSHGSGVVAEFVGPNTFVGWDKQPADSHHYHYKLIQGLSFDCVAALPSY